MLPFKRHEITQEKWSMAWSLWLRLCLMAGVLGVIGFGGEACGQSYDIDSYNGQTVTTTDGDFYDSGGRFRSYSNNENYRVTFSSGTGAGMQLNFSAFSVESGYDFLKIYDGPSTSSPLIGSYTGNNSPGTVTASGSSLTVVFTSDYSMTSSGWAASIATIAVLDFSDYAGFDSASSTVVSNIRMGSLTDGEGDVTANDTATGDDVTGSDDEDGVTVPASLVQGTAGSLVVKVSNTSGATTFLNAWIDFNRNGILTDAGEQVATNIAIATGTSNANKTINFTTPVGAVSGVAGVRVRLTSTGSPGATGNSGNGEVEDYLTHIACHTLSLSPGSLSNGVMGMAYSQTLSASGGTAPYSYAITSGSLPGGLSLNASTGTVSGTPTSTSAATAVVSATDVNGCVVTGSYTITPTAGSDFGDYASFGSASSTLNNGLKIGASTDSETSASTNATATGDDQSGSDDEDGVTLPASLVTGTSGSMVVKVTNTSGASAYLNAWIDYNGNGVLTDAGEQVATNTAITTGTSNASSTINFTVPLTATHGVVGVRVRLTSSSSPGPTGASGNGEVEDNVVTLVCPAITMTPATLAAAQVGSAYSSSVTASGGQGPYTYAVTGGTLPAGLVLNGSTGVVSGTPTAGNGTGSGITLTATDLNGCTGSQVFNMQVCPVMTLSPASLPGGMAFAGYSQTLTANSGAGPYVYAVKSGALPAGLTLNSSTGVIAGRPTTTSSATFTIGATDSNGCSVVQSYTVLPVAGTDYGDHASFGSASSTVVSSLAIGFVTDGEAAATTNATATGDDVTDLADEEGATVPAYMTQGAATAMSVNVSNSSGAAAYLNVWIDFNRNGVLTDSGEQVAVNQVIANGTNSANQIVSFTVPAGAVAGVSGVRVRLTSTNAPGATGASGNGEVEDYTTNIIQPADFGDYALFDQAGSVISANLKMGALTDSETTATTNLTASGDDVTGADDEDGVTLPSSAIQGQAGLSAVVQVTNTTGATVFLNGWIDFNNNGVLTDAGEQIAINSLVPNGTIGGNKTFTFSVPTNAQVGTVGVRFRLTTTPSPGSTGVSGTGEVEDNTITLLAAADFGDFSRFAIASSLVSSNLKMGALVDAEFAATTNLTATGDDVTNLNDEDGATVQSILVQGQAGVALAVNMTNLSGAPGYLNGWVDFNNDGDLNDAGEQIISNVVVDDGSDNVYQTFYFDVPINATTGVVGTRFRLTSVSNPAATGAVGSGEVEDYTTTIVPPASNFKDYFYTIRNVGSSFYLDEISVYNPNSSAPSVSVKQNILNLGTATAGFNGNASNAMINGLALDWLNRRFYWNYTTAASNGYNASVHTANYDNVTKTWSSQQVTGSALTNIPLNNGSPLSSLTSGGAFPRAAFYAGEYYAGGQNNNNVVVFHVDASGTALTAPAFNDYTDFFHLSQTFGGGDFVIRPQDGLLVTSTVVNNRNTLFNQYVPDGENAGGPVADIVNIDSQLSYSSNAAVQIAGVGGVTRLYALGSSSSSVYRLDNYDTASPTTVRVGPLPSSSYTDLSEGISSSVTSLGVKGIVYYDANGLLDNTVNGSGTNVGGTVYAMLVDSGGLLVDSFPVKSDGTFILGGAAANATYTVVLSTTYGSLGSTAPASALPQGWLNGGEYLGNGAGSDGTVDGRLTVAIGSSGVVNANFGILQGVGVGDMVWNDANNNSRRDSDESGISGITVQLWTPGTDNATGGTGAAADTLIRTTTTDGFGSYAFSNLVAGKYFVVLVPSTLYAVVSSFATGDTGVDDDNNGRQPGGGGTAIYGPIVDLAQGVEPGNLATGGTNIDNTIDFGLLSSVDFGDYAPFGSAGNVLLPNLYLGSLIDSEGAAITDATATGDDLNGQDDEDGITVPASVILGTANTLTATVSNTSGVTAFLNVWIDYNRNGDLTDAGEKVASNLLIPNGTTVANRTIGFTVPAGATTGVAGVRVRLSTVSSPEPTGTLGGGEVEDYTTNIVCPAMSVTTTNLVTGAVGGAYSQTLSATGGATPYTWTLGSGALPAGLTLNASSGVISGTPTAAASPATSITAKVTDANGCQAARAITLQICPVITAGPTTLPTPTVGTAYTQTISASGGATPYSYALASGTLPAWATMTAAGVLSGTPTTTATSIFTLRVTDANGCSTTLPCTLTPQCPTIAITPGALALGTVGKAYSQALAASGGIAPYSAWTLSGGALPAGLTLNASSGVISGTPTATTGAATTITVRVNDANGCQGTKAMTLQICPVITLAPTTPVTGIVGAAYTQTITASGGVTPYSFAVTSGTLPTGLALNAASGVVSGTPSTQTSGNVTIRAVDANGCAGSRALTFAMGCPVISITTDSLATGGVGSAYAQTLVASGGSGTYAWTVTSGTLPAGLTLGAATGVISGTPTTGNADGVSVTIAATDTSSACAATKTFTLQICPVIALAPVTLAVPAVGNAYAQTLTASGGAAGYTFTLASGALPDWATLSDSGVLSGTPTSTTQASFTLRATDANGCSGTRAYTLAPVCPTISISPTALTQGTVGTPYAQALAATGGVAPYSAWTLLSGTLPAGLTLNASSGVISGTPTAAASPASSVVVRVNDAKGCQGSQTITLQVCPVVTLAPSTLPAPVVGVAYAQAISASGGASPYTFTVLSGALPGWATLSTAGMITGTPTTTTAATFTVRATDANGCAKTLAYALAPACPVISLSPLVLAKAVKGVSYSQTLTASGGSAPYTWALTAGTLPAGLTLNSSSGEIAGTPTALNATGTSVTLRATDVNGCQTTSAFTLQVCPVIAVAPATLPTGITGTAYNQTFTTTGGTAPYTYSISNGSLPAGLSMSGGGVLTGTPTAANGKGGGFTLRTTDANGCAKDQDVMLKVCPVITLGDISTTVSVSSSYAQTVSASGGVTSTYVFAVASGTLPTGLSLNAASGVISGTPTAPTNQTFTISATDADNCTGTKVYTLAPQCPAISVSPGTPPVGTVGVMYAQTFIAAGGQAPYTYAVVSGNLPAGLNLDTSSGTISGIPAVTGTAVVGIRISGANGCEETISRSIIISGSAGAGCPTPLGQTVGGAYEVTRLGRDVLGGEATSLGTCLYNMSPNGRWITGIRTGLTSHGFVLNTLTYANTNVPLLDAAHPYAMGQDVNDSGDAVGYEKWNSGNKVNLIPWYYSEASGSVVRLVTPYDTNASVSAVPSAITRDSAYAFGTVDPDGPGGPELPQGGCWNLSTRQWTMIAGVREVLDAAADGSVLLITDSSGVGKVMSGTPASGYHTTVVSFTGGALLAGRVSPSGRYIGSSQRIAGTPTPFVYDTQAGTRTNLARILPQDSLGGIVGAVSDTGRVLGSMYSSAATGSFAVMWDTPADLYTRISDLLVSDGHVAQDETYAYWNIYNGGDGISADGTTMGVYGNNAANGEDTMIFQHVAVADTRLCLGNAVWEDTNRNGSKDAGEPGAAGAVVQLFHPGADGVRGGTGEDADYEVAAPITTGSSGVYVFSAVPAGSYYVKVIPPAGLPATSGVVVAVDNGVDNDNNGMQPDGPGTPLYSPVITLAAGTEPVTDGDSNGNTEFTVDFGLGDGVGIGDLVFVDASGDGLWQAGEAGIAGIPVQLIDGSSSAVLLTTVTDANGKYFFGNCAPGTYRIKLPTAPAVYTAATIVVTADNGVDNDSNGIQTAGAGTPTISPLITLAVGTEPGASGNGSYENTIDFGFRSCSVLTVAPNSLTQGTVGTAYTQAMNATGSSATPFVWSLSGGVWPAGLSLSSDGSISGTPSAPTSGVSGSSITVRVVDRNNCYRDQSLLIKVCPVITVNPATLPAPLIGVPYAQTITATGSSATPVVFSASGLPDWLYLDASSGVLSGTPGNATSVTFTVTATDANLCTGSRTYTLPPVCPSIAITPGAPPAGTAGVAYSQQLTGTPGSGLTGQYYAGTTFTTLLLTRQDTAINFDWADGAPDAVVPTDKFSVRWSGYVTPTTSGTYTFQSTTDDGVRVWVNNTLIIDRWVDQSAATYTATLDLAAGSVVPIRMEFYENSGEAVAKLYWSGPGMSLQPITGWLGYTWSVTNGRCRRGWRWTRARGSSAGRRRRRMAWE